MSAFVFHTQQDKRACPAFVFIIFCHITTSTARALRTRQDEIQDKTAKREDKRTKQSIKKVTLDRV